MQLWSRSNIQVHLLLLWVAIRWVWSLVFILLLLHVFYLYMSPHCLHDILTPSAERNWQVAFFRHCHLWQNNNLTDLQKINLVSLGHFCLIRLYGLYLLRDIWDVWLWSRHQDTSRHRVFWQYKMSLLQCNQLIRQFISPLPPFLPVLITLRFLGPFSGKLINFLLLQCCLQFEISIKWRAFCDLLQDLWAPFGHCLMQTPNSMNHKRLKLILFDSMI